MLRRLSLIPLLLSLAALPAHAVRPKLAVVKSADLAPYAQVVAGFTAEARGALDEHTLEEGADGAVRTFKKVAAASPVLVLAVGPAAAVAARRHLSDVPMLFVMVPYFQKYDLESSNTTGVALTSDLSGEFDLLRTVLPKVKRIGVVEDPRYSAKLMEDAGALARSRDLTLVPLELDNPQKLDRLLDSARGKIDALVFISDKTVGNAAVVERLIAFAVEARLPTVGLAPAQVKQGALLALAPAPIAIGQQAGRIANRIIFEKVDPGALAVAPPEGVDLHLNLATARRMGDYEALAQAVLGLTARRGFSLRVHE
jgi:putative ABC transport system substrate-binding protein